MIPSFRDLQIGVFLISDLEHVLFFDISQMLHVWNIYLQNWAIFGGNVG